MSDILYSLDLKDIPEMFMKYNKNLEDNINIKNNIKNNLKNLYNSDIYDNFDLLFILFILFVFYDNNI